MIHAYILRQAVWPLIASVGALGVLALLTQSISTLDLIIDQRQSVLTYLQITALALPQLVSLILPLGVFIAVMFATSQLKNDSELIVCSAAGMSRWQIASPLMKLATAALVVNLAVNLWVQPYSFREMREKLYEVRSDLAAKLIRPGEFRVPAPGLTIYAREIERGGRVVDLFIEDASDADNPVVYMAAVGQFTELRGEPALVMTEGSIQNREENGSLSFLKFDSYPFELSTFIDGPGNLFYKLSDRYLHQLLFLDPNSLWDWKNSAELYAEGHYRLAGPLYNIAFALIALTAVMGGQFSRTGYARRIAIASVAALSTRLVGFAMQSAAADDPSANVWQYVVPLTAAAIAAWMLFHTQLRLRARPAPAPETPQARAAPA